MATSVDLMTKMTKNDKNFGVRLGKIPAKIF